MEFIPSNTQQKKSYYNYILMRKMRADSVLAALPSEQRERLERWLMEEQLGLRVVQERLKAEFGVTVSHDTVARYGKWLREEQTMRDFQESVASAKELPGDWAQDAETLQQASLLLMRQRAFELLSAGDCEVQTLERIGDVARQKHEVWLASMSE